MFRPGFIQPVKGVHSKTAWYNLLYSLLAPVSPLLRRWCPGAATTTAALGRALIRVGLEGFPVRVVTTRDINRLAITA